MMPLNGWQRDGVLVRGASLARPLGQIGCARYRRQSRNMCAEDILYFCFFFISVSYLSCVSGLAYISSLFLLLFRNYRSRHFEIRNTLDTDRCIFTQTCIFKNVINKKVEPRQKILDIHFGILFSRCVVLHVFGKILEFGMFRQSKIVSCLLLELQNFFDWSTTFKRSTFSNPCQVIFAFRYFTDVWETNDEWSTDQFGFPEARLSHGFSEQGATFSNLQIRS